MKIPRLQLSLTRQKKSLLVFPLLILPFLTLFFWALGGGKPGRNHESVTSAKGLNNKLPNAKLKDVSALNKLSYYNQAEIDSEKLKDQIDKDPYYKHKIDTDSVKNANHLLGIDGDLAANPYLHRDPINSSNGNPVSESEVYRKIAMLQHEIQSPAVPPIEQKVLTTSAVIQKDSIKAANDPELAQMNGLLEKVLDIQHPDRVYEKLRQQSALEKSKAFIVSNAPSQDFINRWSTFHQAKDTNTIYTNKFYSLDETGASAITESMTAIVGEDQSVVNGTIIKLKLTTPIFVSGIEIPENTFIYGVANLTGDRLEIKIDGLRYKHTLIPVSLSVYDMDGLQGIEIPGAISRSVMKESAGNSLQNLGMLGYDQSLTTQAASAGIETAKSLFSKKVKLIKVFLKSGYQVLLKDDKNKDY